MFKDLSRTVHLTQDDDHLFVNEALELSQVARHVHLQLRSNLWTRINFNSSEIEFQKKKKKEKRLPSAHLFTGDILQIFLHHDLPEPSLDLTLRQLSLGGPVDK